MWTLLDNSCSKTAAKSGEREARKKGGDMTLSSKVKDNVLKNKTKKKGEKSTKKSGYESRMYGFMLMVIRKGWLKGNTNGRRWLQQSAQSGEQYQEYCVCTQCRGVYFIYLLCKTKKAISKVDDK